MNNTESMWKRISWSKSCIVSRREAELFVTKLTMVLLKHSMQEVERKNKKSLSQSND